ncbi:hypothetical protein ACSBPQ_00065 [Stenotrophomonas sp. JC08]|uniref:hypothetical protein n=1 Tax=Stenotrophomonas sp. JC08 TaxID=3445779 RepID=UPI003FA28BF7
MLDTMTRPHNGRIRIGEVHFSQAVTPVFDAASQRVGFAVEWHNRTQEIGMESRNAALLHQ